MTETATPSDKKKRLFVAVNLSVAATRKIAELIDTMRRLREPGLGVAWVPPENLHVTLKFLGWTSPEAVAAIRDELRAVVLGRKGFEVGARGAGAFPSPDEARVLWVGLDDPSGGLARLAADVEARTERIGFPREARTFHPHVTIGRVKSGHKARGLLDTFRDEDFGRSLIREVLLYESRMSSRGSEYTVLFRAPLDVPPGRPERQTREVEGDTTSGEEPGHGGQSA